MDNWTGWAAALLGFILTYVSVSMRMDKKRVEDAVKENTKRVEMLSKDHVMSNTLLTERVARLETMAMSEREVNALLKEHFDPFLTALNQLQHDTTEIKVQLALLSKTGENK